MYKNFYNLFFGYITIAVIIVIAGLFLQTPKTFAFGLCMLVFIICMILIEILYAIEKIHKDLKK